MDDERLADYLAGELTPDEHAAVEARLAGAPALRARLERMRIADAALEGLETPEPPADYEQRLQAALGPELARTLGATSAADDPADDAAGVPAATTDAATSNAATSDELEARRTARRRRWPLALGGVAAGVAMIAVAGVALSELPGTQDEQAVDEPAETAEPQLEDGPGPEGPVLAESDRDLDEATVAALLEDAELTALAQRGLDPEEGQRLAAAYRDQLVDDPAPPADEDTVRLYGADRDAAAAEGEALDDEAADAPATGDEGRDDSADTLEAPAPDTGEPALGRPLDEQGRQDTQRCLPTLLDDGSAPVVAYVEAASFQGASALVLGLLSPGDDEGYDRVEVQVVDPDTCRILTSQQRDIP